MSRYLRAMVSILVSINARNSIQESSAPKRFPYIWSCYTCLPWSLIFNYRTGVICILLCLAVGISNIFSFNLLILWAILCMCVNISLFLLTPANDPTVLAVSSLYSSKSPCFYAYVPLLPSSMPSSVGSPPTTCVLLYTES